MVFVGNLTAVPGDRCERLDALTSARGLDREGLIRLMFSEEDVLDPARTLDDVLGDRIAIHCFRCPACDTLRAYWER